MHVDDDMFTLDGDCLTALGDNHAAHEECYYFGTVHAIVDLMRCYGRDMVMSDIQRIIDEWDANK